MTKYGQTASVRILDLPVEILKIAKMLVRRRVTVLLSTTVQNTKAVHCVHAAYLHQYLPGVWKTMWDTLWAENHLRIFMSLYVDFKYMLIVIVGVCKG